MDVLIKNGTTFRCHSGNYWGIPSGITESHYFLIIESIAQAALIYLWNLIAISGHKVRHEVNGLRFNIQNFILSSSVPSHFDIKLGLFVYPSVRIPHKTSLAKYLQACNHPPSATYHTYQHPLMIVITQYKQITTIFISFQYINGCILYSFEKIGQYFMMLLILKLIMVENYYEFFHKNLRIWPMTVRSEEGLVSTGQWLAAAGRFDFNRPITGSCRKVWIL